MSSDNTPSEASSLSDVIDGIEDLAAQNDKVAIRDLIRQFGDRSFDPFMIILALLGTTPVSAIPGVPSLIAATIALVASQMLFGRSHIWLPDFIADRSVSSEKLEKGRRKLRTVVNWLDKLTRDRLKFLTAGPVRRIAAGLIMVLCCTIPVLELLPLAAAVPFLSIATLSLSLMVRDGLVMLIALLLVGTALGFGLYWAFS